MAIEQSYQFVVKYTYDAYGKCLLITGENVTIGTLNPFRYKGYYYDAESGMYYCGSRYYVPEWGRWLNYDSANYLDPKNLNGLNLYAYCNNNPINYADPSGHSVILMGILVGAITGAILSLASAYVSDVVKNIKNDGFQWSDFNTFKDNWRHYIGVTLGGAIAGAGVGLCAGIGAIWGTALLAETTTLMIGSLSMTVCEAIALGVGTAFITGGLGYAIRTAISDKETFNVGHMFAEAGLNALDGFLSLKASMLGCYFGINPTNSFKKFLAYHALCTGTGLYISEFIIWLIKEKLEESL